VKYLGLHQNRSGTENAKHFSLLNWITGSKCVSAWNKDPVFGVIGIQSGPRH
jgi:hypothetical protein